MHIHRDIQSVNKCCAINVLSHAPSNFKSRYLLLWVTISRVRVTLCFVLIFSEFQSFGFQSRVQICAIFWDKKEALQMDHFTRQRYLYWQLHCRCILQSLNSPYPSLHRFSPYVGRGRESSGTGLAAAPNWEKIRSLPIVTYCNLLHVQLELELSLLTVQKLKCWHNHCESTMVERKIILFGLTHAQSSLHPSRLTIFSVRDDWGGVWFCPRVCYIRQCFMKLECQSQQIKLVERKNSAFSEA